MKARQRKLLLIALAVGLFLPVFNADAQFLGFSGLSDLTLGFVSSMFAYSLSVIFTVLGKILVMLVTMLDWVVRIRIYTDIPVIQASWGIMRDFANMLFIIALIVMAYGTIFNIRGYDFRSLIPRFIVIAVLINFSLVLGGLMIDLTQVLNNTFLNAMGDISGRLGRGLQPAALLPEAANINNVQIGVFDTIGGAIISLFFAIWLLFAFIVSVAVPLTVAFVRIPVLWALLIVSPMAWLLSILPATKGAFDKWWHQFLAWNLFLPYYLFFLYFALYFLSQQDVVLKELLRGPTGQAVVDQTFDKFGIQNSVTFGLLFYYILVGIFLIGGTKVAMSAGTFSGTGIVNVAKWGRDRVANRVGWTAAGRVGKGLMGQAGEKEEARVSRHEAWMTSKIGAATGGRFGERGAYERTIEEQRAKEMAKERERQKVFANNPEQLRVFATSGSTTQRLVGREQLIKLGDKEFARFDKIQETYQMAGGERSVLANQILQSVDTAKLDEVTRQQFSNWDVVRRNAEMFKKNALAIVEKDKVDAAEVERLAKQLVSDADVKELLEKGNKKNLIAVAGARVKLGLEGTKTIDQVIEDAVKKLSDDQVNEMLSDRDFDSTKPEGRQIMSQLRGVFQKNPKRFENLIAKASGDVRAKLEPLAREVRTTQVNRLVPERQGTAARADKARVTNEIADIDREIKSEEAKIDSRYPTSSINITAQKEIDRLRELRSAKEGELKSIQDKRDKMAEKIRNAYRGGTATT